MPSIDRDGNKLEENATLFYVDKNPLIPSLR